MTTILLDLDGTIVNFCGGVSRLFGKTPEWLDENWTVGIKDVCEALSIKKSQLWSRVNSTDKFWETLEPYPWLDELMDLLSKEDVHICTSPGICDANAMHGKAKWINKYLGSKFSKNFIFTPNKWMLAKPDRILIDDYDKQCNGFVQHGGLAIVFAQHWNSNYMNSHRKIEYVKERLEEIKGNI